MKKIMRNLLLANHERYFHLEKERDFLLKKQYFLLIQSEGRAAIYDEKTNYPVMTFNLNNMRNYITKTRFYKDYIYVSYHYKIIYDNGKVKDFELKNVIVYGENNYIVCKGKNSFYKITRNKIKIDSKLDVKDSIIFLRLISS